LISQEAFVDILGIRSKVNRTDEADQIE